MPHVACPSCSVALSIPERSPVTSFRCPSCQKVLRLNRQSRTEVPKSAPLPTAATKTISSPDELPSETVNLTKSKMPLLIALSVSLVLLFGVIAVSMVFRYAQVGSQDGGFLGEGDKARRIQGAAFSETDAKETWRWLLKITKEVQDSERKRATGFPNVDHKRFWASLRSRLVELKGKRISWTLSVDNFDDEENTLFFAYIWDGGPRQEWPVGRLEEQGEIEGEWPLEVCSTDKVWWGRFGRLDGKLIAGLRRGSKLILSGVIAEAECMPILTSYKIQVKDYTISPPD